MTRTTNTRRATAILVICLWNAFVSGQLAEPSDLLKPFDERSCVFADEEAHFGYFAVGLPDARMRVDWTLSVDGRVLVRGNGVAGDLVDVEKRLDAQLIIPFPGGQFE